MPWTISDHRNKWLEKLKPFSIQGFRFTCHDENQKEDLIEQFIIKLFNFHLQTCSSNGPVFNIKNISLPKNYLNFNYLTININYPRNTKRVLRYRVSLWSTGLPTKYETTETNLRIVHYLAFIVPCWSKLEYISA